MVWCVCILVHVCVREREGEEEEEEEQQRRSRLERKKLSVQPWLLSTQRLYKLLRTISSLCRNETTLKRPLCLSICRTVDTNGPKEMGIFLQEFHTRRRKGTCQRGNLSPGKEILQGPHILSDHLPGWDRSQHPSQRDQWLEGPHLDWGCLDVYFLGSLLNFDLASGPEDRLMRSAGSPPPPSSQCGHWINLPFMLSIFNLALLIAFWGWVTRPELGHRLWPPSLITEQRDTPANREITMFIHSNKPSENSTTQ